MGGSRGALEYAFQGTRQCQDLDGRVVLLRPTAGRITMESPDPPVPGRARDAMWLPVPGLGASI